VSLYTHSFLEVSRSHTHTQTHKHTHTPDRTPLNQGTARRWGRYLHVMRQTQQTNIHTLSGIRTRNPSNQAAADLRLRPHVHWRRYQWVYLNYICINTSSSSRHSSYTHQLLKTIPDRLRPLHIITNNSLGEMCLCISIPKTTLQPITPIPPPNLSPL